MCGNLLLTSLQMLHGVNPYHQYLVLNRKFCIGPEICQGHVKGCFRTYRNVKYLQILRCTLCFMSTLVKNMFEEQSTKYERLLQSERPVFWSSRVAMHPLDRAVLLRVRQPKQFSHHCLITFCYQSIQWRLSSPAIGQREAY